MEFQFLPSIWSSLFELLINLSIEMAIEMAAIRSSICINYDACKVFKLNNTYQAATKFQTILNRLTFKRSLFSCFVVSTWCVTSVSLFDKTVAFSLSIFSLSLTGLACQIECREIHDVQTTSDDSTPVIQLPVKTNQKYNRA